ncbi:MAG: T9SS type A sorting domain-containing protein, partial [Bacteroidetes bacterium]|nr:T9SS type A sorting domain-containing protein [Bacteroidota bacterium]
RFAIGTNVATVVTSVTGIAKGTNAIHTGDLANYTGDDAQFTPTANGQSINITFDNEVKNASFTLYDVDRSAQVNFSASNTASVAQTIDVTLQSSTNLTVHNNNSTTAYITANGNSAINSVNTNSATVTVAGPVKAITITIAAIGSDAIFWLSDINACVAGTFPLNYHQTAASKPFTGQPDYFFVTPDNQSVYYVDAATGRSWELFNDPSQPYVNSLAYDQVHHYLYYVVDGSSTPKNNKALKRYDLSTGTISTVVADLTSTLKFPTMDQGVESSGACFYNGSLYFGIEGGKFDNTHTRKTIVYKIDFDASQNPTNASQVFAVKAYSGSNSYNDWGDFMIKDGVLYNFNTARQGSGPYTYPSSSVTHFDMMTGSIINTYINPVPASIYTGQVAMSWAGDLYNFVSAGVQKYNNTGGFGSTIPFTVVSGPAWPGGAGDASEPFKPQSDFGDAPSSYDAASGDPAVHERSDNIRLGNTWDMEWAKKGTTSVEDTDDGLAYVPIFAPGTYTSYLAQVTVFNNSGANATLCAWLDYNGNGVFDMGEGITPVIVPSSATLQSIYLYWPSISSSLSTGTFTYLRIRITSTSNGMTAANPTGYFSDGEVEDYKVIVDNYPLATNLISFDATVMGNSNIKLKWTVEEDADLLRYEIEKSKDTRNWENCKIVSAEGNNGTKTYSVNDDHPYTGKSYYRLKLINKNASFNYSEVKPVLINSLSENIIILPNPAVNNTTIKISNIGFAGKGTIQILSMDGKIIHSEKISLVAGENSFAIPINSQWPEGTYVLRIATDKEIANKKLIIKR